MESTTKPQPDHLLISYGSLRPGEKNYHVVSEISGEWIGGTIEAEMGSFDEYPQVIVDSEIKQTIPVVILHSEHLPDHWERIDEFEGQYDYQRILYPVKTENGVLIGNLYVRPCAVSFHFKSPES